jgi:hypothetical protein
MKEVIDERIAQRLQLLQAVYVLTGGNSNNAVMFNAAYRLAGLDDSAGTLARTYLQDEGLLEHDGGQRVAITHAGAKECEEAFGGRGTLETRHFPSDVIQHVIQIHGHNYGAVQAGGHGNVSTVTSRSGAKLSDLAPLFAEMRQTAQSLAGDHRDEALAVLDKLKTQAELDKPNHTLVTMYLKGLSAFVELAPVANRLLEALSNVGA